MMGFAAVVEAVLACHGIDRHAADGIEHASSNLRPSWRDDGHGRGGHGRRSRNFAAVGSASGSRDASVLPDAFAFSLIATLRRTYTL